MPKGINRRRFMAGISAGMGAAMLQGQLPTANAQEDSADAAPSDRPNILWIVAEDISRHFGCYGGTTVETPHVDALAAEGVLFENAYVTCPVCSPSRSAMVTGMYQTTIGAHHHRSGRGELKIHLPEHVRLIPELFKEAGYYVTNGQGPEMVRPGKTDYNFEFDANVYDGPDWRERPADTPFFAQIQLIGGKYGQREVERVTDVPNPVAPEDVTLPPYYPDDPVVRQDWAGYMDSVTFTDDEIGQIMAMLQEEGVAENTIVFFITDHGVSHARGKQFMYDEGARIPMIAWGPEYIGAGERRTDLVAHIDMAASSLAFAGLPIPEYLESRPLFGDDFTPRDYVVSARDRCDETEDRVRMVRQGELKYIRNFHPQRPHLQPCRYKDKKDCYVAIRELHARGELSELHERLLMAETRPEEELYDLAADPWELTNLAEDPDYAVQLAELRGLLNGWIAATGDRGAIQEPEAMYDSDMEAYLNNFRRHEREDAIAEIEANITLMKEWRAQGI